MDEHHTMWNGYLHARRALGEVNNIEPLYNIHTPLTPSTVTTLNLFYKEEIRNAIIRDDDHYGLEMRELYHEWLRKHGKEREITLPWIPPPPKEDPAWWAQLGEDWPNMNLPQLEIIDENELIEQQLTRWEEELLHRAWSTKGSSTS